ncbi:nuclear transport factor 2 family protein [Winogradskyella bathintestinalis]|uniref:Nuclear transport factor 2 family protein n=1 Tax=Winogradskyella bathintestinalis TaxID=3035208 RepID=A0ABT7ZY55_9FLAO|nr:nuclear transport factor 2 family protein [Winogradskyella bathintestinalis]MDN3493764.1 nuclear transport factor 2 family protein [Winogradskyella bathintestinalis]
MTAKEIVKAFYNSDFANDAQIVSQFFHKDCELHWTSSRGFVLMDYKDLKEFFKGTRESYNSIRFEFTHLIEAGNYVTTRHTLFGHTIENPDTEAALAHFSAIWEVKEDKLYRGYEISHQADENDYASIASYKEIKI